MRTLAFILLLLITQTACVKVDWNPIGGDDGSDEAGGATALGSSTPSVGNNPGTYRVSSSDRFKGVAVLSSLKPDHGGTSEGDVYKQVNTLNAAGRDSVNAQIAADQASGNY